MVGRKILMIATLKPLHVDFYVIIDYRYYMLQIILMVYVSVCRGIRQSGGFLVETGVVSVLCPARNTTSNDATVWCSVCDV